MMRKTGRVRALAVVVFVFVGLVPAIVPAAQAGASSNTKVFWQGAYDDGNCPENNTSSCDLEITIDTWADSYGAPATLSIVQTNSCIDSHAWSEYSDSTLDSGGQWYLNTFVYVPIGGYQCAEGNATWRVTYDASSTP